MRQSVVMVGNCTAAATPAALGSMGTAWRALWVELLVWV
jgi:hypothetical protein